MAENKRFSNVALFHFRPSEAAHTWDKLTAALENVATVAVIIDDEFQADTLEALATVVGRSHANLISAWGEESEKFHDIVDRVSIGWRELGPLTTWDNSGTVDDFLWNVMFVYRGSLDVADQNRPNLVCYASNKVISKGLTSAIQRVKKGMPPISFHVSNN